MTKEHDDREAYFEYVEDLVNEMHELFEKHEALVDEYSRAMEYIGGRGWRQAYVQRVAGDDSVEGTGNVCPSCGNMKDTPGHELGCEVGREEYGHGNSSD